MNLQTDLQNPRVTGENASVSVNKVLDMSADISTAYDGANLQNAPKHINSMGVDLQTSGLAQMLATAQLMAICAAMGMPFVQEAPALGMPGGGK